MKKCNYTSKRARAGLLTSFGFDLMAGQLSGPSVDRATLHLIGALFASILFPGLATALVAVLVVGRNAVRTLLAFRNS
eukprot:4671822-Amphidinium_carterae.2